MFIAIVLTLVAAFASPDRVAGANLSDGAAVASSPAVRACSTWFASRTSDSDPAVLAVAPESLCFDGIIDARSSAALTTALKSVPADRPTILVVRSGGGGISESLDVAEVLASRNVTVVVHTLCGSGCANGLFLPASNRIILKDAVVVFHGGASLSLVDQFEKDREKVLAAAPGTDVDRLAREWRDRLKRDMARQDAMLQSRGIDRDFFQWFDRMAALPVSSQSSDCARNAEAEAIVFSEAFLRERGVAISYNRGPRTADELHRLNAMRGWGRKSCFWQ